MLKKAFVSSADFFNNFTCLGNSLVNNLKNFLVNVKITFVYTLATFKHSVKFIPSEQKSHQNDINIIDYSFVVNS